MARGYPNSEVVLDDLARLEADERLKLSRDVEESDQSEALMTLLGAGKSSDSADA